LKGRQDTQAVERSGLRLQLMKQQAKAGDIVLLFADESAAMTHPSPVPGQSGAQTCGSKLRASRKKSR